MLTAEGRRATSGVERWKSDTLSEKKERGGGKGSGEVSAALKHKPKQKVSMTKLSAPSRGAQTGICMKKGPQGCVELLGRSSYRETGEESDGRCGQRGGRGGGDTWEWKAEGDRIFFSSYEEEMEKTRFEQKITIALAGSLPAL